MTLKDLYFACMRVLPITPIHIYRESMKLITVARDDFKTDDWIEFSTICEVAYFDIKTTESGTDELIVFINGGVELYEIVKFFQNLRPNEKI